MITFIDGTDFPEGSTMRNIFNYKRSLLVAGMASAALVLSACSPSEDSGSPAQESTTSSADAPSKDAGHDVNWGYEGAEGPEEWGELDPAFKKCGVGEQQSPIDLTSVKKKDLVNLDFNYGVENLHLVNNGHSQQAKVAEGSTLTANDVDYELQQYHFHTPSEHTVDGKPAEGEIHFVHKDKDGNLAVVGALITEGETHEEAYRPIIDNLIKDTGVERSFDDAPVTLEDLLPKQSGYTAYDGSLTTPPCSEDVKWFVLDAPVELSSVQIEKLRKYMGENARPAQDLNGREVVEDSTP
ncbi:carbonic anhydrase family protein [Corynebacterium urealyticum]|nr:carbonic anhydrase family protein [Corynebacterium urealyticum]